MREEQNNRIRDANIDELSVDFNSLVFSGVGEYPADIKFFRMNAPAILRLNLGNFITFYHFKLYPTDSRGNNNYGLTLSVQ